MIAHSLTAAVIGTGFIGPVHVEGLRRNGIAVAGILGSSHKKSSDAAESLALPCAYRTFDQVLEDAKVKVVHLASPNKAHFGQAVRALRAGKHVLCEKPLAMNSRESAELVQLAQRLGVAAGVNYNVRYYPLCLEAAERTKAGAIGDVWHVSGSYAQDWLFHDTDFNWRVLADAGGELRAMADIGTHWFDLIQFITERRVSEVCADLATVHPVRHRPVGEFETFSGKSRQPEARESINVTTEDIGAVLFRFEGGGGGAMHVSQITAGRKNCLQFELAGSKQSFAWNSERPNELLVGHRDQPNELLTRDPALLSECAARRCSYPGGHNEGFGDTFKQLFRDFYEDIASGAFATQPRYPTFEEGHREILLCEAILTSHHERRWISVESDCLAS